LRLVITPRYYSFAFTKYIASFFTCTSKKGGVVWRYLFWRKGIMKTLNQQFEYTTPSTVLRIGLFLAVATLGSSLLGGTQLMAGTMDASQNDGYGVAIAASGSCCPPPSGMVAWWPLDGPGQDPSLTDDIAGVANDGIVNGATYGYGEVGGALCFDGVNDFVEVQSHPEVNFQGDCTNFIPDEFTIAAWVRTDSNTPGVMPILDKRVSPSGFFDSTDIYTYRPVNPSDPIGYHLYLYDGRLGFQMADGGYANYISSPIVADGQWHFIAVTVKRPCPGIGVGYLYVDDNPPCSFIPVPGNISNNAPLLIGKLQPTFGSAFFHGCIDELEIFNRALSEAEINAIYAGDAAKLTPCGPGEQSWIKTSGLDDECLPTPLDPPPTPSPDLLNRFLYPAKGYDDPAINRWFFHTFLGLPSQITQAWLVIGLKPGVSMNATNDTINLCFTADTGTATTGTTEWSAHIGDGQGSPPILNQEWLYTNYPNREIIPLNLHALPGGGDLIPSLNTAGFLDVVVQDDTNIDFVTLRVCHGCVPPPSGIVDWWPFDEPVPFPSFTADIAGFPNGGTVSGAICLLGKVGKALHFGDGDFVNVADHPEVNFLGDCTVDMPDEFTIDAWVKTDSNMPEAGVTPILDKRVNLSTPVGYYLYLDNGFLGFQMTNGLAGPTDYIGGPPIVADGQWHFIAVTVQRLCSKIAPGPIVGYLYVDGVQLVPSFVPKSGSISNNAPLLIGKLQPDFGSSFFHGWIDELEIFKRALSQEEIEAIYDANSAGKCKPDLGDAPDSTNHAGIPMTTYTAPPVTAHFPTVYDPPLVGHGHSPGPIHLQAKGLAWLGKDVSFENDADLLPDQDGVTNIAPPLDEADRDEKDDGIVLPIVIPACAQIAINYIVTTNAPMALAANPMYLNVWFDFNRDGDWDDIHKCAQWWSAIDFVAKEWAVQNVIVTSAGLHTTPLFTARNPDPSQPMWMRVTLSEQPAPPGTSGHDPDGRGPVGGYKYGETEDYLVQSTVVAELSGTKFNDLNGDGVNAGEPGLYDWRIMATGPNGIVTALTDLDGHYSIAVPVGGPYTVAEQQTGWDWTQTAPASGTYTVTVPPSQTGLDFGNKQMDVVVEEGRLVFHTEADLQAALDSLSSMDELQLDAWEEQMNFYSMRRSYKDANQTDELPIADPVVATLLSPQAILQVGENAYKVDKKNESVFVVKDVNSVTLRELEKGENGRGVLRYSTDDDVIPLVEGESGATRCSETSSASRYWSWTCPFTNHQYQSRRLLIEHANNNFGVSFSLEVKCSMQKPPQPGSSKWTSYFCNGYQIRADQIYTHRKPRCKPFESSWETGQYITTSGNTNYFYRKPYYRTRGLYKYYIKSTWSIRYVDPNGNATPWTTSGLCECQWNYP
jgi:hypothetical protein